MHFEQSTRRNFMTLLGGAALSATPLAAFEQTPVGTKAAEVSAKERDLLLHQAKALGAPVAAVGRAIETSREPKFTKKDVLAIFDMSQPSAKKRFYLVDIKSGQVTAHYAAHGRHNGPHAKATKFAGFQNDLDMVPLGPLKTARSQVMDHYKTIVDRYDGTVYRDMIVAVLGRHHGLQQLHQSHAAVRMDHPPELVHHRRLSRQEQRRVGTESRLHHP